MELLKFQPIDTTNLKWWSTSANYMQHKGYQKRYVKTKRISVSRLYFEITLETSIAPLSDWKHRCPNNRPLAVPMKPPWTTKMY